MPEDWVSSARWNPTLSAIEPRGAQGHMILKLQVQLKPCVLNNPNDSKHATIPFNTFMSGKDGPTRDTSSLYDLVCMLHRQHFQTLADLPPCNSFVLEVISNVNDDQPSISRVQKEWWEWERVKDEIKNMGSDAASQSFVDENEAVNRILQVVCRDEIAFGITYRQSKEINGHKDDRATKRRRKEDSQSNALA